MRKRSKQPSFDKKAFERRIVDAFVQYYLNNDGTHYEFASRPDEKYKGRGKLPDFEYAETYSSNAAYIEIGRITADPKVIMKHDIVKKHSRILCDKLNGNIKGSYSLAVSLEELPESNISSKRHTNRFFKSVESNILMKSSRMPKHVPLDICKGIQLVKHHDDESLITPFPFSLAPHRTHEASVMEELLNETSTKFNNINAKDCIKILLLLHRGPSLIANYIEDMLNNLKRSSHMKETGVLSSTAQFFEVHIMCFPLFWNKNIIACQCYPRRKVRPLCTNTSVFGCHREYKRFLYKYFPG